MPDTTLAALEAAERELRAHGSAGDAYGLVRAEIERQKKASPPGTRVAEISEAVQRLQRAQSSLRWVEETIEMRAKRLTTLRLVYTTERSYSNDIALPEVLAEPLLAQLKEVLLGLRDQETCWFYDRGLIPPPDPTARA